MDDRAASSNSFYDVSRGFPKEDLELDVNADLARGPLDSFWRQCEDAKTLVWTAACLAANDPPLLLEVVARSAAYVTGMLSKIPASHQHPDLGRRALEKWVRSRGAASLLDADRTSQVAGRASRAMEKIVLAAERCERRCKGVDLAEKNIPYLSAKAVSEAEGAVVCHSSEWYESPWYRIVGGDQIRAAITLEYEGGVFRPRIVR